MPRARQQERRPALSFFALVGGAMAALKVKEQWDNYKASRNPLGEGRIALDRSRTDLDDEEASVALLDTEIPVPKPTKRKSGCCICCGVDCSLLWKAIGIILAGYLVFYAFKLVRWAYKPWPPGFENIPAYSTSLGCLDKPQYSGNNFSIALGSSSNEHSFDVRGGAVGTVTIVQTESTATEIQYGYVLHTNDESLIQDINIQQLGEGGNSAMSNVLIDTPPSIADSSCLRFDLTITVPAFLQKLSIAAHATTQVRFTDFPPIVLANLAVKLYSTDSLSMVQLNRGTLAREVQIEVSGGWIVGDIAVTDTASIITQNGDGGAQVNVYPTAPEIRENPEPVVFRSNTGSGPTSIVYFMEEWDKRPIDNLHTSSGNGDVYLDYKKSQFNGKIAVDSSSYSMRNVLSLSAEDRTQEGGWTNYVGDMNGGDKLKVTSRGWTGLYF